MRLPALSCRAFLRFSPRRHVAAVFPGVLLGIAAVPWGVAPGGGIVSSMRGDERAGAAIGRDTLATITTDTGAFAPGHKDFSRYTKVGLCLMAVQHALGVLQRPLAAQVFQDTAELMADTIGYGAVVPLARACGARFTIATTPPRDIRQLFELAVYERQLPLAQAALDTVLAWSRNAAPVVHAHDYYVAFQRYLEVGWTAPVDSLLARGVEERPADALFRIWIYQYYADALFKMPVDRAVREAALERVLRFAEAQSRLTLSLYTVEVGAWRELLPLEQEVSEDSIYKLAAHMQRALWRYRNTKEVASSRKWNPWGQWSLEKVIRNWFPHAVLYRVLNAGFEAPRLHARYWYPVPGHPASDTVIPVPGKVNVICHGGETVRLREWLAAFPSTQLAVTVVRPAEDKGVASVAPGAAIPQLFPTAAQEAEAWRWYEQEYLQLPVTVAVQVQHATWLPAPDGRRLWVDKLPFNQFWAHDTVDYLNRLQDSVYGSRPGDTPNNCVVVGRDGRIVYAQQDNKDYPNDVNDVLRWLLHGSPGSSRATGMTAGQP